jgi:hypothetical protein
MQRPVIKGAIDKVIARNLVRVRNLGVLAVRPGCEIAGHELTGIPAVVVTVHTKKTPQAIPNGRRAHRN